MSITSKNSLPNIADHEQKALAVLNQQRFAISPAIQSNLGFDTSLLGLARPDSKALDHSVTAAQLAVALSDTDPVLNFNLAAALLAHRQLSQALLSYKKATNLVGCGQADLIGDAITDLHVVLRYCRGVIPEPYCRQLEAEAPKLKAALAAAAWPPGVWLQDSNISNLDLIAFPSGIGWSAQLHNVHLDRDVLAVIWYARDGDWDVWRVLPAISGPPDPENVSETADRIYQFRSHLKARQEHTCLADGKYRAEVYLNGQQVGESVTSLQAGPFAPSSFSDLNLAICSPADWHSVQPSPPAALDLVRSNLAPGGQRGAMLFTYYNPQLESDETTEERFMRKSASYLLGETTPASPPETACAAYPKEPGVRYARYRHGNTAVLAKSWIADNGFAYVGLVFDHAVQADPVEEPSFTARMFENCNALVSITNMY